MSDKIGIFIANSATVPVADLLTVQTSIIIVAVSVIASYYFKIGSTETVLLIIVVIALVAMWNVKNYNSDNIAYLFGAGRKPEGWRGITPN